VVSASATQHDVLTVTTAGKTGGTHGSLVVTREPNLWRVVGSHGGQKVNVTIRTSESVPAITFA
jgi:hypothetical protein